MGALLAAVVGALSVVLWSTAVAASAAPTGTRLSPDSGPAVHHDVSPPLRSLPPSQTAGRAYPARPTPAVPAAFSHVAAQGKTMAAGSQFGGASLASPLIPSTSADFDGIPANGFIPPDPSGAAGLNQYVEVVNVEIAVYSKSGTPLLRPEATNTLWSGFGGGCEANNNGDATVLFDTMAQRWVVQQFSVSTTPYLDCVAISKTSDATGEWYRYSFKYEDFPDYPKMGVWPDAYYASFNMFNGSFAGAEACAYDRAAMLKGEAASQQCFIGAANGGSSLLPATLDGTVQPPSGEPEWFVALSPTEAKALAYWKFHVDWGTPSNTTFSGPTNLGVEAFSEACGGGACVPQAETTNRLDSIADRLMFRLAYRNFGGHESLVVDHAIETEPFSGLKSVGVRWYELRPSGGSLTVYQQGTYSPNGVYRWMGSTAMDRVGDMALGYSGSNGSLHPQIRYTGRLAGDPLGTMSQGEATLYAGSGSQTAYHRWGDYTEMSVDPSDDCTFWYVNEYQPSNGVNWRTRIGSFKFSACETPVVKTEAASGIGTTEMTLNATVNPTGHETNYYFEYGTSTEYASRTLGASAGSGTSDVHVSQKIAGLVPNTTYHYRIVASNTMGTTDGFDETATTLAALPVAKTEAATDVNMREALLRGSVNPEHSVTSYYFEYGKTTAYGSRIPAANAEAGSGVEAVAVSQRLRLPKIEANQTYHYRIVATNGAGTVDGEDQMFGTPETEWRIGGVALPEAAASTWSGQMKLTDESIPAVDDVECETSASGSVGTGNGGEVKSWTASKCVPVNREETLASCKSGSITLKALHLPWRSELVNVEGVKHDVLVSAGSGTPGFKMECELKIGGSLAYECTGAIGTTTANAETGVLATLDPKEKLTCNNEPGKGVLEGAQSVEAAAGGRLSAVNATEAAKLSEVEWRLGGTPLGASIATAWTGNVKLTDESMPAVDVVECEVSASGSATSTGLGEIVAWTASKCVPVNKEETLASCNTGSMTLKALHLPWRSELVNVEGVKHDVLVSAGSGAPGLKMECALKIGGSLAYECTGAIGTTTANAETGVVATLDPKEKLNCNPNKEARKGVLEGSQTIKASEGGKLEAM